MSSKLIKQIQIDYKNSFKDKSSTLDELWSSSKDDPDLLGQFLHRLVGSAGLYGYDEISTQANRLQSLLNRDDNETNLAQEYLRLSELINQNIDS